MSDENILRVLRKVCRGEYWHVSDIKKTEREYNCTIMQYGFYALTYVAVKAKPRRWDNKEQSL
jgi:hypothetical protein